jgi:hypothetical protein
MLRLCKKSPGQWKFAGVPEAQGGSIAGKEMIR